MSLKSGLLIAALALPASALAQFFPPAPLPTPVLVSPAANATAKGIAPNMTTLQVKWIEYGAISTPQQTLPSYFVVCVKPVSQMTNCTFQPANFLPVGSLSATRVTNSNWQTIGWQYTYTLAAGSLSDTLLDVDSLWSVGACRNATVASCVFSATRALYFSTKDLAYFHMSNDSTPKDAVFIGEATNAGADRLPSLGITTDIDAWDAVRDPATGRCLIDVDNAAVRNDPDVLAFLQNGQSVWVSSLPIDPVTNKRTAPGKVAGMSRGTLGTFRVRHATHQFAFGLNPMASGEFVTLTFALPAAQRPQSFVVVTRIDTLSLLREFDESNNAGAACGDVP